MRYHDSRNLAGKSRRSEPEAAAARLESVLDYLASQEENPDEHMSADAKFYRQQLLDARRILAAGIPQGG